MANFPHRGFVRARFALIALCASAVLFAAPSMSQASEAIEGGRVGTALVSNPELELICMIEPWYCFDDLATVNVKKNGSGSGTVISSPLGINCGVYCSGQFQVGSTVTLTAIAGEGSKFTGWSGGGTGVSSGCSGTGVCKLALVFIRIAVFPPPPPPPVSVTATFNELKPNLDLTVSKTGVGFGTVASSPAGLDCGGTCTTEFEEGKEVMLGASADPGSEFGGWTGCESEVEGKCVVTMSANTTVKAKFNGAKALSMQKAGAGLGTVKSSPAGINCMTACDSARIKFPGTGPVKHVTLTATPYKGSTFVEWGGDCSGKAVTCEVTLSAAKSVTAKFAPIPKVGLTLNKVSGAGTVKSSPLSINCAAACSSQASGFYEGSEVTLTAIPYKSAFVQWTGACSGSSPTCKVTMSEAKTVGAEFTGALAGSLPLTLKKTAAGTGTGTGKVQAYVGGINCDANCATSTAVLKSGAKVVFKQTPSKGAAFVGWGGACSGSGACEVTLLEAEEVTAEFEATPFNSLTVKKAGGGTGVVRSKPVGVNCGLACSQAVALFPQMASVSLTAVPGKGSGQVQWGGCDEVTGGICIATMSAAKEVTAKFE